MYFCIRRVVCRRCSWREQNMFSRPLAAKKKNKKNTHLILLLLYAQIPVLRTNGAGWLVRPRTTTAIWIRHPHNNNELHRTPWPTVVVTKFIYSVLFLLFSANPTSKRARGTIIFRISNIRRRVDTNKGLMKLHCLPRFNGFCWPIISNINVADRLGGGCVCVCGEIHYYDFFGENEKRTLFPIQPLPSTLYVNVLNASLEIRVTKRIGTNRFYGVHSF